MDEREVIPGWLWGIIAIVVLIGAFFAWYFLIKPNQKKPTATPSASESLTTYTNDELGYSFQYPASWQEVKQDPSSDSELVSQVEFTDPVREKEILTTRCVFNEKANWGDINYPKETCEPLIASLSQEQKDKMDVLIFSRNLYAWVYKPKEAPASLADWLNNKYSISQGQATGFQLGPEITLAGQKGYAANIACCADYNMGYMVQKGDYIYRFGTEYKDVGNAGKNNLLDEFSQNFKFTK